MNAVVVDTDVVSLVFKADSRAEKYVSALSAPDLLVSFMTEAELERWILQARWGSERIIRFRTYMKRFVSVPSSRDLIVKWAEVGCKSSKRVQTGEAPRLLLQICSLRATPSQHSNSDGFAPHE